MVRSKFINTACSLLDMIIDVAHADNSQHEHAMEHHVTFFFEKVKVRED